MGLLMCMRPGDQGTVVEIGGEIDIVTEDQLREMLLQVMSRHNPRIMLDLSRVSFLDCSGIRVLISTRRRAELLGGELLLIAVSPRVGKILRLTGMQDVLPVHEYAASPAMSAAHGAQRDLTPASPFPAIAARRVPARLAGQAGPPQRVRQGTPTLTSSALAATTLAATTLVTGAGAVIMRTPGTRTPSARTAVTRVAGACATVTLATVTRT